METAIFIENSQVVKAIQYDGCNGQEVNELVGATEIREGDSLVLSGDNYVFEVRLNDWVVKHRAFIVLHNPNQFKDLYELLHLNEED